jgi:hypothetical protein
MYSKNLWIAGSVLISALHVNLTHAATSSVNSTLSGFNNATSSPHENRHGGVVSKITDGKIEINAVTYSFLPNQAKIYDLNGRLNPNTEIKAGMFVNFALNNTKPKTRIIELRLIRK